MHGSRRGPAAHGHGVTAARVLDYSYDALGRLAGSSVYPTTSTPQVGSKTGYALRSAVGQNLYGLVKPLFDDGNQTHYSTPFNQETP